MSLSQPTALSRWSAPLLLAALAILFAGSAITKAMDVDGFARLCERILSAAGLPYQPGMAIAVAIILIESVLAFLLGARVLLRGALIASLGMLLAFVAAPLIVKQIYRIKPSSRGEGAVFSSGWGK